MAKANSAASSSTPPPRKPRRLWRIVVVLAIGSAIAVAALPTILSTGPACRGLLAIANRSLAPAQLELGSLKLSWLGPLRLSGVVLRDPHGKQLVAVTPGHR